MSGRSPRSQAVASSTYCSSDDRSSNRARSSGTPMPVLIWWPPCSRLLWNGPTATAPHGSGLRPGETLRSAGHLDPPELLRASSRPVLHARVRHGRLRLGNRPQRHPARRIRSAAHCAGHDEDRGTLPTRRGLERPAESCRPGGSNSAPHRRHSNPQSAAQSTTASSGGSSVSPSRLDTTRKRIRRATHLRAAEIQAVIVYLSDVQPNSQIDDREMEPLDNVLISAFTL